MYSALLKAVADMFSGFFNWRTAACENEVSHEVVGDKQDLERACLYAEYAFEAVEQGAKFFNKRQKFKFEHFKKKFRKLRCS